MAEKHFLEQKKFAGSYLIPYFKKYIPGFKNMTILEIGCAEAGFLDELKRQGIQAVGLELAEDRVAVAKSKNAGLKIYIGDIGDHNIVETIGEQFDLIVMRDVIEHIENRNDTFNNMKKLLKNMGYLYITFPPRFSAYAGHQQNGISIIRFIPYFHLLPKKIIQFTGAILKENKKVIAAIISNYRIGLTIHAFEKYCQQFHFTFIKKEMFLFRPIFQIRFNLKIKRIPNIPLIREFMAFGCECLLQNNIIAEQD